MTALLSYAALLGLGGLVAFEDWRTKKIRNRLIVAGLGVAGAALGFLLINTALGSSRLRLLGLGEYWLPWRYYPAVALHVLLSFAAALVLWRAAVWPAGDAKFFTVVAAFAALVDPNLPGFPRTLFLILLINVFVPAGAVFALGLLARLGAGAAALATPEGRAGFARRADEWRVRAAEAWAHRAGYAIQGVNLFALFAVLQLLLSRAGRFLQGPLALLAVFTGMTFAWQGLAAVLRKREIGVATFAALCVWAAAGLATGLWDVPGRVAAALRATLSFGVFLSFARLFVGRLAARESVGGLDPAALRQGVVLSDETWALLESDPELAGRLDGRRAEGLSAGDAELLKERVARLGSDGWTAHRTIPFAFWILLGVLLTLTLRGNVVAAALRAWRPS